MREKTVLVLSIIIASGLGVSTAIFGVMNMISVNSYNVLTEDYEKLSGDYGSLLSNYSGVLADYYSINEKYQNLIEDYGDLNETYFILTGNYTELQDDYNSLVIDYAKLIIDYNDLMDQFDILQQEYNELQGNYTNLQDQYDILQENYTNLQGQYDILLNNYNELLDDYNDLSNQYDSLNDSYNTLKTYISTLILPAQYLVFAEAVRRYYTSLYLGGTTKEWYMGYAEFCRDIVLHDTEQENSFQNVSNALSECMRFGNETLYLAWLIMYMNFYPWLPNWDGWGLSGNELTDIDTVHQWCINEIDYEYDSDIRYGQENPTWDYPKFSVETAFRTMGDCEDQAILDASYLESCGFETMIAISHDPNHPTYGSFYHGSLKVHIEDTDAFYAMYPFCPLWRSSGVIDPYYPDYTWCWLDPTWDVPFGSVPSWLADYGGSIPYSVLSIAICDIDGGIVEPELQCELP